MTHPPEPPFDARAHSARERGVALIIALILLVVLSVLAALSVRNATSTEAVTGNVRLTQLANQSAEAGLRYCEDALINLVSGTTATFAVSTANSSVTAVFTATHIIDVTTATATLTSVQTSNWDTTTVGPLVLPLTVVNPAGASATYSRPPECMVERTVPASVSATYSASFIITARGFGPEVPAVTSRAARPVGSEVWMQSTIDF